MCKLKTFQNKCHIFATDCTVALTILLFFGTDWKRGSGGGEQIQINQTLIRIEVKYEAALNIHFYYSIYIYIYLQQNM
jgi:hypothetical protein